MRLRGGNLSIGEGTSPNGAGFLHAHTGVHEEGKQGFIHRSMWETAQMRRSPVGVSAQRWRGSTTHVSHGGAFPVSSLTKSMECLAHNGITMRFFHLTTGSQTLTGADLHASKQ